MKNPTEMHTYIETARSRAMKRIQDASGSPNTEDALQDALVRYLTGEWKTLKEEELVAWLVKVARRRLTDNHRHDNSLPSVSLSEYDLAPPLQTKDLAEAVAFQVAV